MSDNKQFDPSERKKKKAEEDGNIPRSRELTAAMELSAGFLLLLFISSWGHGILDLYHKIIEDTDSFDVETLFLQISYAGLVTAKSICICFGLMSGAALLSELFQVGGFKVSLRHVRIDFSRLNPFKGFMRILGEAEGKKAPTGLLLDCLKIGLIGGIVLLLLWARVFSAAESVIEVEVQSPGLALGLIKDIIIRLFGDLVLLSLLFGIFSYWLSRRRIRKDLMMDFEELKREHKDDEGDPHVRGQRKQLHQEVLLHGMIENVRKARVVIVKD
ncbi:MAG TPA: EscU/YscU/HrcU family type III secretion system export apparatus switch protein [Oligoflexia bacterium]|nr:EscU/YscU/HrcU family type III secretion system export apparatus switch protein [Oligoflexia bacterium]HMP49688.1 EscU/YscU/HrcU family type III secretion system export apparatus switch protein [Oligoflexia bacterium]